LITLVWVYDERRQNATGSRNRGQIKNTRFFRTFVDEKDVLGSCGTQDLFFGGGNLDKSFIRT
jgi:hypothetical protein